MTTVGIIFQGFTTKGPPLEEDEQVSKEEWPLRPDGTRKERRTVEDVGIFKIVVFLAVFAIQVMCLVSFVLRRKGEGIGANEI